MILDGFCAKTAPVWQFAGYVVTIFKIVIPAILVVLGVVALGKAVIAADDKEIKTAANSFIKKFIVAVIIFFIPTIVSALFDFVWGTVSDPDVDYDLCVKCIANPGGSKCDAAATAAAAE